MELCKSYLRDGTLEVGGDGGKSLFFSQGGQIFVFRCWPGEGEVDRKWVRMLVVPFRGQKKNQRPSWYVLGPFPLNKIPEISITKAILMI